MSQHYCTGHKDPENKKSKWFARTIVFLAIVFCAYQFGFKPIYDNYEDDWNIEYSSGKDCVSVFVVGLHIGGKSKVLKPGKYYIDPEMYKID
jgi:hypothetical protein